MESYTLVPGCEQSISLDFEAALAIPGTASRTGMGTAALGWQSKSQQSGSWGLNCADAHFRFGCPALITGDTDDFTLGLFGRWRLAWRFGVRRMLVTHARYSCLELEIPDEPDSGNNGIDGW